MKRIIILLCLILISGCVQRVACTEDAKICPDGSAVGRIPPDCEFEACPPECRTNLDCVPSTCCHPTGCTPKSNAPDCSQIMCTQECVPGTMDCGQGSCQCIDGTCEAVIN
ncbi:hypothetical protein KY360_06995 [Candidatus Woesearchaeota archaeon]|nr:hypothetical protein [Candidatus Woesearchaeota archaeon]